MLQQLRTNRPLDEITLDVVRREVSGCNGTYSLTPIECQLLKLLMLYNGQVVRRAFLMKAVWETEYLGDTRTLDVHMSWLRKKIEKDPRRPRYLRTVRGIGYSFVYQ
jgi:DNA-binding response OmpR family regulator